jgi:hypothetical protein
MPRFHFHLRVRGAIHRDPDGTDLPDIAAARAHAAAVAGEFMLHTGGSTRHWSMFVEDDGGHSQFDLFFADVDPSIDAYSPRVRTLVVETCRCFGALTDTLCAARALVVETRRLLARSRRKPQLAYARGE